MPVLKFSRQREAIRQYLCSSKEHPTADMVYEEIKNLYPNISLGTVYRNLSLLVNIGEAIRISTSEGADRFDGHVTPHNHFICTKCGRVMDLDMENIDGIQQTASQNFKGKICGYTVNFYGLCEDCLTNEIPTEK